MHRRSKPDRISNDVTSLQPKSDGVAAILAASETIGGSYLSTPPANSIAALLDPITCVQQVIKDDDEAALILDAYQTHMSLYLPFVAIPVGQTVHELKQLKPFLFMVIMTVSCPGRSRPTTEQFHPPSDGLNDRSWFEQSHKPTRQNSARVNGILQAARSSEFHGTNAGGEESLPRSPLCDFQRKSGGVSIWARDMDHVKYSRYADECCRVLEQTKEYPSDEHLVVMIRIMSLCNRIRSTFSPEESEPSSGMSAPVGVCVKSFEAELEQLKTKLPTGTQSAEFLSLHYSFLQVFLYEVAVHDTIANTGYGALPMTRLKMLFTCLDVVKQFFENFGAISPAHYFNFTYFTWSLAGHVSVVLSKLCIFSGDSWDPNFARSTIDFPAMVHEMQEKLKQAAALAEQSVRHTPQAQSPYR
ncbi:hypothetical protein LTR10_018303 [Elasticomyces elasticus]|nr:hypothetical protein LTR10_018303 [Elasticomyces elasticus]KAK5041481.1 hypothetical protein LTR13_002146 [Exophiala sideris]